MFGIKASESLGVDFVRSFIHRYAFPHSGANVATPKQ